MTNSEKLETRPWCPGNARFGVHERCQSGGHGTGCLVTSSCTPDPFLAPRNLNSRVSKKHGQQVMVFDGILKNSKNTLGALEMHDFGFMRGVQVGDRGLGVW